MVSAVVMHVMPYLSNIGITRAKSSLIASAIPLTSICGRLGLGWLGDKVGKRRLMAGGFAMMGAGLLCFGLVAPGSSWILVTFLLFWYWLWRQQHIEGIYHKGILWQRRFRSYIRLGGRCHDVGQHFGRT